MPAIWEQNRGDRVSVRFWPEAHWCCSWQSGAGFGASSCHHKQCQQDQKQFESISRLIREWQPVLLVVGLPLHADGIEHELTSGVRRFARRLEGRFGIKTVLVDERHTSINASTALREAGIKEKSKNLCWTKWRRN